jgi:hypothetical protein
MKSNCGSLRSVRYAHSGRDDTSVGGTDPSEIPLIFTAGERSPEGLDKKTNRFLTQSKEWVPLRTWAKVSDDYKVTRVENCSG